MVSRRLLVLTQMQLPPSELHSAADSIGSTERVAAAGDSRPSMRHTDQLVLQLRMVGARRWQLLQEDEEVERAWQVDMPTDDDRHLASLHVAASLASVASTAPVVRLVTVASEAAVVDRRQQQLLRVASVTLAAAGIVAVVVVV